MKNCMVALLVVVSLVVVAESKTCRSESDCSKDECCWRNFFHSGMCRKRGSEGEFCEQRPRFGGVYLMRCPCLEGLDCVSERRFGGFHFETTCVRQSTSTPEPTSTTVLQTTEASTVKEVVTEEVTTPFMIVTDKITEPTTHDEDSLETVSSESD